jgi:hypothetical protein
MIIPPSQKVKPPLPPKDICRYTNDIKDLAFLICFLREFDSVERRVCIEHDSATPSGAFPSGGQNNFCAERRPAEA